MKNLVGAVESYFEFVLQQEEYRTPEGFVACLADATINYWRMLVFVLEEENFDGDFDDAAKAEENLIYHITTQFTDEEKAALQQVAQRQLEQRFTEQPNIDPEDESQNREQRFLTFIAAGRFDNMDLL